MNLSTKKELAKRTFNVGKDRIVFADSRLEDIKEAITKQDMRDLKNDGAIIIREASGRKKIRSKSKRGVGNVKKVTKVRKRDYVVLTRKLRRYASETKKSGEISKDHLLDLRKKIRNKTFRSKAHLKEHIGELKK